MRKIAIFTGTRAEYGLLYWLMRDIQSARDLELQIIASGLHFSPEHGYTYREIEKDGFHIDAKVEMMLSADTPSGITKSIGVGLLGYADELKRLAPDVLVVLGDRFEALAMAQAARLFKIPILHLHGGEVTEGVYDESFRHAITKLSMIHCTAAEEYRRRVIQLGEEPERVFNVGAIGLEHAVRTKLLSLKQLSGRLGFKLSRKTFLLTYHPVTLADEIPVTTIKTILRAVNEFGEYKVIVTYPNLDEGGRAIIPVIEDYAEKNSGRVHIAPSLGQVNYLSALKNASLVIGNSSSGIIEAPAFGVPTINIGERQSGRLAAKSVLNSGVGKEAIVDAIKKGLEIKKNKDKSIFANPYGSGNVSKKIVKILRETDFTPVKRFYDLTMEDIPR